MPFRLQKWVWQSQRSVDLIEKASRNKGLKIRTPLSASPLTPPQPLTTTATPAKSELGFNYKNRANVSKSLRSSTQVVTFNRTAEQTIVLLTKTSIPTGFYWPTTLKTTPASDLSWVLFSWRQRRPFKPNITWGRKTATWAHGAFNSTFLSKNAPAEQCLRGISWEELNGQWPCETRKDVFRGLGRYPRTADPWTKQELMLV